jgi:hypothetical protein
MTNIIASITHKFSGTTEESIYTSGNNNSFGFTLFNSRARENLITGFFTNGQRFTSKSSLINRNITMSLFHETLI